MRHDVAASPAVQLSSGSYPHLYASDFPGMINLPSDRTLSFFLCAFTAGRLPAQELRLAAYIRKQLSCVCEHP